MNLDIEQGSDEKDEAVCSWGYWIGGCCSMVGKTLKVVFYMLLGAIAIAVCLGGLAVGISGVAVCAAAVAGFPVSIPLVFVIFFSLRKKTRMRLIARVYKPAEEERSDGGTGRVAGMYKGARFKEEVWERIIMGSMGIIARASLGALVWLGLSLGVPRLRAVTLLGSPMWKWSLLGVTLTASYFEALALILPLMFLPPTGTTFFYIKALLLSINHVTYFGLLLGAWLGYFRTHRGLSHSSHQALQYVTWTFVSLLVGSILFLLKNLLLLKWSADAIYRRFEHRILITSLKFYFIGRLAAGFDEDGVLDGLDVIDQYGQSHLPDRFSTTAISKYVMSRKMSLSYLGYVSRILMSLTATMSPLLDEEEDQIEVVTWFKHQIQKDSSHRCTPDGLLSLFATQKEEAPAESPKSRQRSNPKVDVRQHSPLATEDVKPPARLATEDVTEPPIDRLAKGDIEPPDDQLAKGEIEPAADQLAKGEIEPAKFVPIKKAEQPELLLLMGKLDMTVPEGSLNNQLAKKAAEPANSIILLPGVDMNRLIYGAVTVMAGGWNRCIPTVKNRFKSKEENESTDKNMKLAYVLWRLVGEDWSHAFTFDDLNIWLVDAHKDCINMGRTLTDAMAIVTRLDIFISFNILVVVLLLWLLITGVSSTTVLVTVATPFLALTFIFGDSAKTFFQGFIFCFATHPFDVGDRCILDGVELEVRKVSIITTTFIKIGSKEKRLYPNSILATLAIVNLGWQPDPKDMVELSLSASTNIDGLDEQIKMFFQKRKKHYEKKYDMMISEVGENIKVKIHFSHILTVHDLSHSQCLKKKSLQRSDFLSMIRKHINESRSSASASRENIELTNTRH